MRKTFITTTILICLISNTVFADVTVAGIKSQNNKNTSASDLKVSQNDLKQSREEFNMYSDYSEYMINSSTKDTSSSNKEISWLLENNVLFRDSKVTYDDNLQTSTDTSIGLTRSDFLMNLYRTKYGVIKSRALYARESPTRVINGEDKLVDTISSADYKLDGVTGEILDFSIYGDYSVYYNPNVYELYLSSLLDKNIINKSNISNSTFLNEYSTLKTSIKPRWSNELTPYTPLGTKSSINIGDKVIYKNSTSFAENSSIFGKSWEVTGINLQNNYDTVVSDFSFIRKTPFYFSNETISYIEALRYAESILRITERDMTDTEAKIITYKYGVNYLEGLPTADKKTLSYLIARGVLSFENKSEFNNLYNPLTLDQMILLLYRVANSSARVDFSKIQLTDSDNFWLQKGFSEDKLNMYQLKKNNDLRINTKVLSVNGEAYGEQALVAPKENKLFSFKKIKNNLLANGSILNSEIKSIDIEKIFDKNSAPSYKYQGTALDKLEAGKSIKSVETQGDNLKIVFTVNAPNVYAAITIIDSSIELTGTDVLFKGSAPAVTKFTLNNKRIVLVSGNALKSVSSEIYFLEDKVLVNRKTGATALLMPDSNLAIVGNEIMQFAKDELLVSPINGELYYNLEVISRLMSESYIESLDHNSIFLTDATNNKLAEVVGNSNQVIDRTYIDLFKNLDSVSNSKRDVQMVDLTNLTRGLNTIIGNLDFNKDDLPRTARVIVSWKYIMPKPDTQFNNTVGDFAKYFENNGITVGDMAKFLTTRPTSGELQQWWDSNINITNALMNTIMGTSDLQYGQSGWLAPSVTFLVETEEDRERIVNEFLNKLSFSSEFMSQFGVDKITWKDKLMNANPGSDVLSILYSSRKFESISGSAHDNGVLSFRDEFAINNANHVFVSDERDDRFTIKSNNGKNYVYAVSRENIPPMWDAWMGDTITWNGNVYTIQGLTFNNEYVKLVAKTPVSGTPIKSDSDGKWRLVAENNDDVAYNKTKELTKSLQSEVYRLPDDHSMAGGITYENDKEYTVDEGRLHNWYFRNGTLYNVTEPDTANGIEAYSYPTIFLNKNAFTVEDNQLVSRITLPYLQQGNLFYSGMANGIIDSILAKSFKFKKLSELPTGSRIILGDTLYTVNSTGAFCKITSDIIYNQTFVDRLSPFKMGTDSFKSGVIDYFKANTLNVNYSGKEEAISLSNYLQNPGIGSPNKDSKANGNVIINNGGSINVLSSNGSKRSYNDGDKVDGVIISVDLKGDILFRPINDNGVFVLVQYTDIYSEGYLTNLPFFKDRLNTSLADDLYMASKQYKYTPFSAAKEIMAKFIKANNAAFAGGLRHMLLLFAFYFIAFIIVLSWVLYGILNLGTLKLLLYMIRDGSATNSGLGGNGIDLVHMFTFGLFSLDTRMQVFNLFVGNLSLIILMITIWRFI